MRMIYALMTPTDDISNDIYRKIVHDISWWHTPWHMIFMTYPMTYDFSPFHVLNDVQSVYVVAVSNEKHMSLDMSLQFLSLGYVMTICHWICHYLSIGTSRHVAVMTYKMLICHHGNPPWHILMTYDMSWWYVMVDFSLPMNVSLLT